MAKSNSQNCIKILKVFDLAFTINSNEILIELFIKSIGLDSKNEKRINGILFLKHIHAPKKKKIDIDYI